MRVKPPDNKLSDLLYNAEQLHADLLDKGLLVAAASAHEVVTDLRMQVREEREGA